MKSFLGFRLHKGAPDLPTKLKSYTSTMLTKASKTEGRNNYTDHQIATWYGISFKLKWFAGIWVFGQTTWPSEDGPVPTN